MENKHYSKLRNMVTDMSDGDFILGEENNHVEIGNIYKFNNICMTGDTGYGQSIYIHTLLLDLLNNCKDVYKFFHLLFYISILLGRTLFQFLLQQSS